MKALVKFHKEEVKRGKMEKVFNCKVVLKNDGIMPKKAHETDAGFDICANEDKVLKPSEFALVGTGVSFLLEDNPLEVQVRSRSGLSAKNGIFVLNSPGTIDQGYTGEVKIILANFGKEDFLVNKGDRIAQLVFAKTLNINLDLTNNSEKISDRGDKGFGSTGV